MSRKVKTKKKKVISLVPVKEQEKSLVVVKKEKFALAKIWDKEVFKKVAKSVSLVLIGVILVAYILLMALVATSVFYVTNLENGLIQKGVFVDGIDVSNLTRRRGFKQCCNAIKKWHDRGNYFEI